MRKNNNKYPLWKRIALIAAWTLMAVVLAIYGTVTCVVTVLTPQRLTPIAIRVANAMVDARVDIDRVEFTAMATYPFLRLEVDSLLITCPSITPLIADTTYHLPAYADTLMSVDRFSGEIKLTSLLLGHIDINDVSIVGPALNIVSVADSVNNYNIFPTDSAGRDDSGPAFMPKISIRRFAIEKPKSFRYYDAVSSTFADLGFSALLMKDSQKPVYDFNFDGRLISPELGRFNLNEFPFSLDGDIHWDAATPYRLRLDNFDIGLAFVSAGLKADIDFENNLTIRDFETDIRPVAVSDILSSVPDSIKRSYGLDALKTPALISASFRLDSVYDTVTDTIPFATVSLKIDDAPLQFGRADFRNIAADITATLRGGNLDDAMLTIDRLDIAGPATSLKFTGSATDLISDPLIDIHVDGYSELSLLPERLTALIGSDISGRLTAALTVNGRPSMLSRNKFHNLRMSGDIGLDNIGWASADTLTRAYVQRAALHFGTNEHLKDTGARRVDLLAANIKVDSASVRADGLDIAMKNLSMGFAADNKAPSADTTVVTPMGGGISMEKFYMSSLSDSTKVFVRNISGRVIMRRFNSMSRVPEFRFDLGISRIAALSPAIRLLLADSKIDFSAYRLPSRKPSARVIRMADSIRAAHPEISVDSAYACAYKEIRRTRKSHRSAANDSTAEVIDWGTDHAMSRILLNWTLQGSLSAARTAVYTPLFPLRSRMNNLKIDFNNDSLVFSDVSLKIGRSDFTTSGRISNIRRSLTSRRRTTPLRLYFDSTSDTIDINQIADAIFRGADYGAAADGMSFDDIDSDNAFERDLAVSQSDRPDEMSPVLIPVNIRADLALNARNIIYSDLLLHDLSGDIRVYDGAVNIHRFRASSDVGDVDLSALYSAPDTADMNFGFGLKVNRFDISRFMTLMPALDSIMPLMRDFAGIIDADVAATVGIEPNMDFRLPSLTAAIKLEGDSLRLLDAETFKTISKWLMFKDKKHNIINHMNVELVINDNQMYLYPFVFDIDRYRLGVQGSNDLAMNFNYKISVLKSPLPFKFGITLKGNPDDFKIRLGRAKFDEHQAISRTVTADKARVNLIDRIENVFRQGVRRSKLTDLQLSADSRPDSLIDLDNEPVSASDSILFINEGLIEAPDTTAIIQPNPKDNERPQKNNR